MTLEDYVDEKFERVEIDVPESLRRLRAKTMKLRRVGGRLLRSGEVNAALPEKRYVYIHRSYVPGTHV